MKIRRNRLILTAFALQIMMLLSVISVVYGISCLGETVVITMTGCDPYDALRGRYLRLNMPSSDVVLEPGSVERYKNKSMGSRTIPVYVALDKDPGNGLSRFSYATLDRPDSSIPYIRCPARYLGSSDIKSRVDIQPRITQYYLNETHAQQLDRQIRWDTDIQMRLKIWKGLYVVDGIEIDGQSY